MKNFLRFMFLTSTVLAVIFSFGVSESISADEAKKAAAADKPAAAANVDPITLVSPKDAEKLLATDKNITIIDVRTPEEYGEKHIVNAVNIDFRNDNFMEEIKKLNPEGKYMVYCRTGGRSTRAANAMKDAGFKNILNLEGGITSWEGKTE